MKKSVLSMALILMVCLIGLQSIHGQSENNLAWQPTFGLANQSLLALNDQVIQMAMGNHHSGALSQHGRIFFWISGVSV